MDKPDITDARKAENPRKIGKFLVGLFIALAILLLAVLIFFFFHHTPVVQR